MTFKLVELLERPRCERGVVWSGKRLVLAKRGSKELWWRKSAKFKSGRWDWSTSPAGLYLFDQSDHKHLGTRLSKGRRWSKKLLAEHAKAIDEFFGCPVADKLDPKKTLIIEG